MEVFARDNLSDIPNLKILQKKDAYCRHICKSLHIPLVQEQFALDDYTL